MDLLRSLSDVDSDLIIESEKAFAKKKKGVAKAWVAAAAACLCLCVFGGIPALAASGNDLAYEMLYSVYPAAAQRLKPVNVSCEDNGIVMTVEAAEVDGEKATVLVSLRDAEGSRIDDTTDLYDSYSIHTPYDQCGCCEMAGYDEETHTAVFMISIEQMDRVIIPGDKITFSVSELLCGKKKSELRVAQIDFSDLPGVTDFAEDLNIDGWGGADVQPDRNEPMRIMAPDENGAVVLTPGVTLTRYGIVDGKLHIQLRYTDIRHTDNHGWLFFKDGDGEIKAGADFFISAWDGSRKDRYEEYIFDAPVDELAQYELWGEFCTCDNLITGNWEVTFPVTGK
jgi:hypothetical protein